MTEQNKNIEMVRKYSRLRKNHFAAKHWKKIIVALTMCVVFVLATLSAFTIGLAVGKYQFSSLVQGKVGEIYSSPQLNDVALNVDFAPFWDAWVLLEENFVDKASIASTTELDAVEAQEYVWGAISGLTRSYGDPFTSFLPPKETESFNEDIKGEFSGVGMEIGNRDGYLTVISPIPGTPAERAGMRPQDIVSEVDGVDTLQMPTEQAVQLIRGPKGESVVLTVIRKGEPEELTITIVRDVIKIPTLETGVVDDVFIIKLYSFTSESPKLFQQAVKEFADSGTSQLILDLRGNPGGYLEAAVSIASWFLSDDKVIVTEQYGEKREDNAHYSYGYNVFNNNLRMVILQNGGSASASEIVASALRDHGVALLVGQNSFGKGSVQELFNLTRETSIKITIAKWLTPSGDHISENGLATDIEFDPYIRDTEDEGSYGLDFSQDSEVLEAIKVLSREDFFELFLEESVPQEK